MNNTMLEERAYGALIGLAIGDALGMPTQSMSADQIRAEYGAKPIRDFVNASPKQPIAPNMKAGSITDDTEQALVLANQLIAGAGELDIHQYAQSLLNWEDDMKAKDSLDLLGPSTKSALEQFKAGVDVNLTGIHGTTNGGAMRACPIGIANRPDTHLADTARRSSIVTHNTMQGIESTMLIAATVSYGLEGAEAGEAMMMALNYVTAYLAMNRFEGMEVGHWSPKASVIARTRWAIAWAHEHADSQSGDIYDHDMFGDQLRALVGTSVEANESVPAAFAIATRYVQRPFDALCVAANVGGDTDTIGAMVGAMLGAVHGAEGFPAEMVRKVQEINHIDMRQTAKQLLAISRSDER
ncbi:ADP-ribosylglycohydrolase [Bifidobacterium saguini DSM 23967]|uniref:ADP-ribosylglycohydrolase n=2 Tax=Bifidobacterium saguini TaxID=762210 RepID=A0A087D9L5_9BIFI|nr:ADP-ribosylglycohydrolase family protein [Bifidobacterium saguini]KFI92215.1 ADP-ribosylglycohydrolase [Bifidobacterium saguini DSM 23967]QTB90930.1 ADP-ribosylglycohydrolase family protein [Bifidobacterium saguini]